MGLRGPAPASADVKRARGERRPSRVNNEEPQFEKPKSIDPPRNLVGTARNEWIKVAPLLEQSGALRETDLSALEDYCRTLGTLRGFEKQVAASSHGDAIMNGWLNATLKLRAQVIQLRRELGLSPLSRSSIKTGKKKEQPQTGQKPERKTKVSRYIRGIGVIDGGKQ